MRRCVPSSSYFNKISTLYNNTFDTTQTILWFLSPFKLRYFNFLKVKHSWILSSPKTCSIKQVQTTGQTSKSYSFDSTVYTMLVYVYAPVTEARFYLKTRLPALPMRFQKPEKLLLTLKVILPVIPSSQITTQMKK